MTNKFPNCYFEDGEIRNKDTLALVANYFIVDTVLYYILK